VRYFLQTEQISMLLTQGVLDNYFVLSFVEHSWTDSVMQR
jgi:hypothetical protein